MPKIRDKIKLLESFLTITPANYISLYPANVIEDEPATLKIPAKAAEETSAPVLQMLSHIAIQNVFHTILGALLAPTTAPQHVQSAIHTVTALCTHYTEYVRANLPSLALNGFVAEDNPVLIALLKGIFTSVLSREEVAQFKDNHKILPYSATFIYTGTVFGATQNVAALIALGFPNPRQKLYPAIHLAAVISSKAN